jgi:hypothetical protein
VNKDSLFASGAPRSSFSLQSASKCGLLCFGEIVIIEDYGFEVIRMHSLWRGSEPRAVAPANVEGFRRSSQHCFMFLSAQKELWQQASIQNDSSLKL